MRIKNGASQGGAVFNSKAHYFSCFRNLPARLNVKGPLHHSQNNGADKHKCRTDNSQVQSALTVHKIVPPLFAGKQKVSA
jgi:hypothetical protein